jgi:hypothetical protein
MAEADSFVIGLFGLITLVAILKMNIKVYNPTTYANDLKYKEKTNN